MIGITSTVGAYDAELAEPGHTLRDLHVAGLAGATVLGVLLHAHRPLLAMLLGLLVAFGAARRVPATTVGLCIALSIVGAIRSDAAWADAVPRHVGAFAGWARVVGDPMRSGRSDAHHVADRGRALRRVGLRVVPTSVGGSPTRGVGARRRRAPTAGRQPGARAGPSRGRALRRRVRRRRARRRGARPCECNRPSCTAQSSRGVNDC